MILGKSECVFSYYRLLRILLRTFLFRVLNYRYSFTDISLQSFELQKAFFFVFLPMITEYV